MRSEEAGVQINNGMNSGKEQQEEKSSITFIDIFMITLAAISVILLLLEYIFPLTPLQKQIIIYADLGIVAIFIAEFVYNIRKSESKLDYAIERWYEIIGMIPAAHPLLRGFRLFRIFRIFVIASRFLRTINLTFGENILFRIIGKYKNIIVEELYQMMTVRALDMIEEITSKTDYTQSVQKVIERRQDDINTMVKEKMDKYTQPEWLTGTFFYRKLRDQSSDLVTRVVIDTLEDKKTNEILSDVLKEILGDVKNDVRGINNNQIKEMTYVQQNIPQE